MVFSTPSRGYIPKATKEALYAKQKGKCDYCGQKLTIQYFHIDHKTPVERGGSDRITNLQLLCSPCNTLKGKSTDGEFRRKYRLPGSRSAKKPPSRPFTQKRFEKITKERAAAKAKETQNKRFHSFWIRPTICETDISDFRAEIRHVFPENRRALETRQASGSNYQSSVT